VILVLLAFFPWPITKRLSPTMPEATSPSFTGMRVHSSQLDLAEGATMIGVGISVDTAFGEAEGVPVGDAVGTKVGDAEGVVVGGAVGTEVDAAIGLPVGNAVGTDVGDAEKVAVDGTVGADVSNTFV